MTKWIVGIVLLLAVFASACATAPADSIIPDTTTTTTVMPEMHDDDGDHTEGVVNVTLDEFTITPLDLVDGEEYTFNITNDGMVEHEFRFVMPSDIEGHEHEDGHDDDTPLLAPGETVEYTFVYSAMYFQVACLLPGHYDAGMFTVLGEPVQMGDMNDTVSGSDSHDDEEDGHDDDH